MKRFKTKYWVITNTILLIAVVILICALHKIDVWNILSKEIFWSILGIVLATAISVYTHFSILKRDKRINTISELSKIRTKYPNLKNCVTAGCVDEYDLYELRSMYLKEMEYFCIGVKEDIFDMEIMKRMSGHMLAKQYDEYMRKVAMSKVKKSFEYKDYMDVMEQLCSDYRNKEND